MRKIPQLLSLSNAANELRTTSDAMREMDHLGLAVIFRFEWGREKIRECDLPVWREAVQRYERLLARPGITLRAQSYSTKGFVYFVQCKQGGPIKIGTATKPEVRLAALQAACPYELKLLAVEPGGPKQEHERHWQFRLWRLHGEWFRDDCRDLNIAIRQVKREWGTPRKNRVPRKIRDFVESQLSEIEAVA